MNAWRGRALVALLAAFACLSVFAQEASEAPRDALERGTPLSSVKGFLRSAGEQDYETAARYLDLRNLPSEISAQGGPELARQLNFVLSRSVWFDDYVLDDTPSGKQGDSLPEYRDELARIPIGEEHVVLYMQHVPRNEDRVMIWKVSNRSIAEVPKLYAHYANPDWVEYVRERLPENASFLGLELYKWVIALGIGLLSWPLFYLLGRILTRLLIHPDRPLYPYVRKALTQPMVLLAVVMTVSIVVRRLGLGAVAQQYADAKTLMIVAVVWVLWAIIGLFQHYKSEQLQKQGREGAARLVRPAANFIRLLVLLVGLLVWLSNVGFNISTVLAGLGVGGLALALALQKPIEDLMGALTLFSQQPVRVGDFCKYAGVVGVVEEIGLRTTRIRTLGNTLVSVPNARIAHTEIENYTRREKFYYNPELRLRYDTSPDQVRSIIEAIRQMLENHERVRNDILRVRFTNFEEDAIKVKVHSYVDSKEIAEFFEIAEELNLNIMDIIAQKGASFALPGRMLYQTQ